MHYIPSPFLNAVNSSWNYWGKIAFFFLHAWNCFAIEYLSLIYTFLAISSLSLSRENLCLSPVSLSFILSMYHYISLSVSLSLPTSLPLFLLNLLLSVRDFQDGESKMAHYHVDISPRVLQSPTRTVASHRRRGFISSSILLSFLAPQGTRQVHSPNKPSKP